MLQLSNIRKAYRSESFTQTALDDVSINFRDNEFVAILGPSGSGKTTLLNIIGGLDHYDSGDLAIDGVSTKRYKDRDWDSYRNNRIGFVFQSYNLIPHQTVLANVELALTLSGVSRDERRSRAREALTRVGLGDHMSKKPSQLSGGQMQRVAIARALINDPDILLADEPTGALDSKTSVQIMDLLTEIAADRLVIMVTHNPELAEKHATRIVHLTDGTIRSDSDPYEPSLLETARAAKPARRTSMSFFTALSLSFNNLMTKKGRTVMTAFAGSIGIIGIATILSLANGVNAYIASVEEETLSEYPLQIQSTGIDLTSMLVGTAIEVGRSASADEDSDTVHVINTMSNMLSSVTSNDLASFKEYLENGGSGIEQYTNAIEYSYDVTPQIYSFDTSSVHQVHPDSSLSSLGISSQTSSISLIDASMSTNVFYEIPSDTSLYEDQYDVVAGRWPESYDECVLVLTSSGGMSDFLLYTLGLRDEQELADMVAQFAAEEDVTTPTDITDPTYDDILAVEFKLVNASDYYEYDETYGVWRDKTGDADYMRDLIDNGETIRIVGIVQPSEDATASMLSAGIGYLTSLTDHVIEQAAESQIVQDQLANPTVNVFTGTAFGEEDEGSSSFSINSLFTIDGTAIEAAFTIDQSALSSGLGSMSLDLSSVEIDLSSLSAFDASSLETDLSSADLGSLDDLGFDLSGLDLSGATVDTATLASAMGQIMQGFWPWYAANAASIEGDFDTALSAYLASSEVRSAIDTAVSQAVDVSDLEEELANRVRQQVGSSVQLQIQSQVTSALTAAVEAQLQTAVQTYVTEALANMMSQVTSALQTQVSAAMQQSLAQLSSNMASAMSIDSDAFTNAFQFNMDEESLTELIMSMMRSEEATYASNLASLGYADADNPSGIDIYPIDFESKERIVEILDDYNARMRETGEEDKVVTYTDLVGTLMSSITTIIDMISSVLIAFVAISLVVSSIMIGVITYISVLERNKEIGILRSIGASKGDVGRVFNAETLIEGFVAGVLGIAVTALLCIPANAIVYSLFDVPNVAILPWQAAITLIAISMLLTLVAGVIPSRSASRKDPVEALRSE